MCKAKSVDSVLVGKDLAISAALTAQLEKGRGKVSSESY
jgi:hypothetical protein